MTRDYRLEKFYNQAQEMDPEENPLKKELKGALGYGDLVEIARGGMKIVYKAFDSKTNRNIALAKLQVNKDKTQFEAFIREARLTAKLEHPNIINVYDVGLDEKENPYFTMELKSGDNLQDILSKLSAGDKTYIECYPLEDLLQIFVKVCDAISYAHAQKIIHLDLKPDNVQVGAYGEVVVCDWGICKIYDKEFDTEEFNNIEFDSDLMNSVTLHGDIKGTPGFMAPE
ncbi:MAG: serine/threonine protein kinase, partial [Lentisphaeraceae bacterium]|nr:serine/threonine protein kinase [Lentisphaeraceae bacterium]